MRVFIVTPAKVGSASFLYSLKEEHEVVHYHSLDRLERELQMLPPSLPKMERPVIVSGFRDPVARNMSYFFQTFTNDFVNDLGEYCYVGSQEEISNMSTSELIEKFWKMPYHETPIKWFLRAFGLLQIDSEFEKSRGFTVWERPNFVLLLYRLEDLSASMIQICEFFGVDSFQMANRSRDRWYRRLYDRFQSEISFDSSYIDTLYDNEVMRYFYTRAEIMHFRSKYRTC